MKLFTDLDIDENAFRQEMHKLGVILMYKSSSVRMVESEGSGLLVHNDEEACWFTAKKIIEGDLLESLEKHSMVNAIHEEAEGVYC